MRKKSVSIVATALMIAVISLLCQGCGGKQNDAGAETQPVSVKIYETYEADMLPSINELLQKAQSDTTMALPANFRLSPVLSLLGYAPDTEVIENMNKLLACDEAIGMLPADLKPLWGVKNADMGVEGYPLYLGKGNSVLDDSYITGVMVDDESVRVEFNAEGADLLRNITANAVGKQLVICLNDTAYMAPKIGERVESGALSIYVQSPQNAERFAAGINKKISQK